MFVSIGSLYGYNRIVVDNMHIVHNRCRQSLFLHQGRHPYWERLFYTVLYAKLKGRVVIIDQTLKYPRTVIVTANHSHRVNNLLYKQPRIQATPSTSDSFFNFVHSAALPNNRIGS